MFREALHGEAPKGQPMILGETLEAVCVEAPEGQPVIRRRHTRKQLNKVSTGKEPERWAKTLSLWS